MPWRLLLWAKFDAPPALGSQWPSAIAVHSPHVRAPGHRSDHGGHSASRVVADVAQLFTLLMHPQAPRVFALPNSIDALGVPTTIQGVRSFSLTMHKAQKRPGAVSMAASLRADNSVGSTPVCCCSLGTRVVEHTCAPVPSLQVVADAHAHTHVASTAAGTLVW